MKRVILIVLDSVGIGEAPDAAMFKDEGSNTLKSALEGDYKLLPNMARLGLFNMDGMDWARGVEEPLGTFARMTEASMGKDTTIGHWEIAGIVSDRALPTFPDGFDSELIEELENQTGRKVLCNKPYSGTKVIEDFGKEHEESGGIIVYTSADSVLQIAAHEDVIGVSELYEICEKARKICTGKWGVGRIIARPFVGTYPDYVRTSNRHDYSLKPSKKTVLDYIKESKKTVKAVGKIYDIFAGEGISEYVRTSSNNDGIDKTLEYMIEDFDGIIFTNLVDFDMSYGHRNDVQGYKKALIEFDTRLPEIIAAMKEEDVLMITADHGCDPATPSTDHSREYTPFIMYGQNIKKGHNMGTRDTFADIGATIANYLEIWGDIDGKSMLD
ncbi:MAG: phosphopentomutase [Lachnospiraceae bacterium]|nr:phosphopentomutase [Lachnospiraceae bacterium]